MSSFSILIGSVLVFSQLNPNGLPLLTSRRFAFLVILFLSMSIQSKAYKPEDPEVRSMVDRAIKYLESQGEKDITTTPLTSRRSIIPTLLW
jgi:hypothetical protein